MPRRSNRPLIQRSMSASTATVSPQTSAIASRVRSSGVGPSPPVVITRSACASASRSAPATTSRRSGRAEIRSTSTPSAVSSRAISPELVSWVSPTSSSAPTASSSAPSIRRSSVTRRSLPSSLRGVPGRRGPCRAVQAPPSSGHGHPGAACRQQARTQHGHRLEVEGPRIAHLAPTEAGLELVDAAVGDAPHVVVARTVRGGATDGLPLQEVVGAGLGTLVVHAAAGLGDGVTAADDEQTRHRAAGRRARHQQVGPVFPERVHDAPIRPRRRDR